MKNETNRLLTAILLVPTLVLVGGDTVLRAQTKRTTRASWETPIVRPRGEGSTEVDWSRSLLDRNCVAFHSDRARMARLSLQTVFLDRAGHQNDEGELWEKVILKLRSAPCHRRAACDPIGLTPLDSRPEVEASSR